MRLKSIALITLALLSGCASPPKREPPDVYVDIPESYTAYDAVEWEAVTNQSKWWREFEDARLDSLIDEGLRHNHNLHLASARVDAAAAEARAAGVDLYPDVSARFDASRRRQNLIGFPIPGRPSVLSIRSTSVGVSLDVAWEVDLWGRVRSAQSAALAELEASWADLAGLRLSIAAQTAKAAFAVMEAQQQLDLARRTVESFRLSAQQVRRRYQEGVRSSLDLRLALSNLYAAQSLEALRSRQLDSTKRQLEILLGRYPSGLLSAVDDLPSVKGSAPPGLPSDLLIRRPDLLAAERRFAAAEKRVSEARRAFFPRIALTGNAGTLSSQLGDLVDGDFGVWSIAAGIVQPIFQGGRLRANLARSEAVSDQALASYALSLLGAFAEVEMALYAEETLGRQESYLHDASEQSRAARRVAERQYNAGLVDYITVLETQRRELTADSELLNVRRQRLDARVNLHVAIGGGFDLNQEWRQFLEVPETFHDAAMEANR